MLITTGGGTRSRHIYTIGLEMGMPTGSHRQVRQHGFRTERPDDRDPALALGRDQDLPFRYRQTVPLILPRTSFRSCTACRPMTISPSSRKSADTHSSHGRGHSGHPGRSDRPRRLYFHQGRTGTVYRRSQKESARPSSSPKSAPRTFWTADQDDLVIERPCLEIIQNSEVIEKVQIINGLVEGNITKALNGEHVGTFIYKQ